MVITRTPKPITKPERKAVLQDLTQSATAPSTMSQLWENLRVIRDEPYVVRLHHDYYLIHPVTHANARITTKSGRWSSVVVFDQRDHIAHPDQWLDTAYGVELHVPTCGYRDGLEYLQAMFYGYEIKEVKTYV